MNAIVHSYDGLDFIELEIISAESAEVAAHSFQIVQGSMVRIQQSFSTADLWQVVVTEAQRITGYDRAMLYKLIATITGR